VYEQIGRCCLENKSAGKEADNTGEVLLAEGLGCIVKSVFARLKA